MSTTQQKIISLESLPELVAELKSKGRRIVTTNGAFDLLHIGHKRALESSKALGDILIVGMNSDASIKQYKSVLRPIIPEAERAEMLAALSCVDYVTIFSDPDPLKFLGIILPHFHTKGGTYEVEKLLEYDLITKHGGKIILTEGIKSTTGIIEEIVKRYGSAQ